MNSTLALLSMEAKEPPIEAIFAHIVNTFEANRWRERWFQSDSLQRFLRRYEEMLREGWLQFPVPNDVTTLEALSFILALANLDATLRVEILDGNRDLEEITVFRWLMFPSHLGILTAVDRRVDLLGSSEHMRQVREVVRFLLNDPRSDNAYRVVYNEPRPGFNEDVAWDPQGNPDHYERQRQERRGRHREDGMVAYLKADLSLLPDEVQDAIAQRAANAGLGPPRAAAHPRKRKPKPKAKTVVAKTVKSRAASVQTKPRRKKTRSRN